MNSDGRIAQAHWAQWLPQRYATINDPEEFFTILGTQARSEIDQMYHAMLQNLPADLAMEKVEGWCNAARSMAEEKVLAELALLTPETEEETDDEDPNWRDRYPNTIVTDVVQQSYDTEQILIG